MCVLKKWTPGFQCRFFAIWYSPIRSQPQLYVVGFVFLCVGVCEPICGSITFRNRMKYHQVGSKINQMYSNVTSLVTKFEDPNWPWQARKVLLGERHMNKTWKVFSTHLQRKLFLDILGCLQFYHNSLAALLQINNKQSGRCPMHQHKWSPSRCWMLMA